MNVVRASIFCIRYMPTLRTPVRGSFVITAGSVMNGAGSPGQQCWIGSASRSGSSTSSWQAPRGRVFGIESASRLSLPSPFTFSTSPCGGCISSTSSSLRATSSRLGSPKARHIRRSVPNWLMSSGRCEPLTFVKSSAGPPRLDRAVDDLGDLEVRVDLGLDLDELALPPQEVDPGAQVSEGHRHESIRGLVPASRARLRRCSGSSSPSAITPRKMSPTTSIERMMSRPSSAGVFSAARTSALAKALIARRS